jgi:Spy/CpxP family protein refolding chaperone
MKNSRWITVSGAVAIALLMAGANAETSPYAGQHHAAIKALGADEQAALLAGQGMGFAKAAELNGYPGPLHVLQLADALELTAEQKRDSQALFERMRAAAQTEGTSLIEEERVLDRLYASKSATRETVDAQLARIEAVRARLRGVHLHAHLEQAALLTPAQIRRYAESRGYGPNRPGAH